MTVVWIASVAVSAAGFFAASRVLIVAGKGGVGKTTVGAAIGLAASRAGADVLLVELEGHSSLGRPFGIESLGYDEVELADPGAGSRPGRLRARRITPDEALNDYLGSSGAARLAGRLASTGLVEAVLTAAPGIRDLLALGKIRQLEQAGAADLIVVDAPATGHAVSFLESPSGLASLTAAGPVRHQADLALDLFADERRCRVLLVTVPAEQPVTETIDTAYQLEERVGVKLAPIVVNQCWAPVPELESAVVSAQPSATAAAEAGRYRLDRVAAQRQQLMRLAEELPLAQVALPHLFAVEIGGTQISHLAQILTERLDRR